ncbi:Aquaporin-1 [Friedmanniomyces endolithicus]|uniref:Aquaporin-1 n=1 Tax=Friedmanniomyces endolithicus TaxID=329885 RepID=A0AAN6H5P0_9PEZI|nr:Aquaporin-1 [Friedmanniomyces endolithicus]KAK0776244.1 Aquaporin-1 [Friedmanniomyces endolithicus]KAK0778104.1 Aquaporin-1 [Friedmanniomyces endolithicus]KAK0795877.1 Aquaporin-1 [Friedmanniomyces endolithicus]KAK0833509.1 Aquaporin-1 [Friedmanniomyces endolithicus]
MEQPQRRPRRLPFADRLNDTARNHFVACCGEFIGTFFFLLSALSGTQVANTAPNPDNANELNRLTYIALAFGLSLAVNAWVWFRVSGGLFNPAVTLGLYLTGFVPLTRSLLLALSQLLGGTLASYAVLSIFPGPLAVTTSLSPSTSQLQGFLIETLLTTQLLLAILLLAGEKHAATPLAPIGIGLSLFIAELSGVAFTGGSLNPARSFGPAVVLGQFGAEHWVYWAGPAAGAVLAAGLYGGLKVLDYERANPGQDGAGGGGVRLGEGEE